MFLEIIYCAINVCSTKINTNTKNHQDKHSTSKTHRVQGSIYCQSRKRKVNDTNPQVVTRAQGILVCWIQGPSWAPSKCHCSPTSRLQHVWLNEQNWVLRNSWCAQMQQQHLYAHNSHLLEKSGWVCHVIFLQDSPPLSLEDFNSFFLFFCSGNITLFK